MERDGEDNILPVVPRRRRPDKEPVRVVVVPEAPEHSFFIFGFNEDRNATRRRKMEDSHSFFYDFGNVRNQGFFAVFDGHGGKSAADWCGEHFPELLLAKLKETEKGKGGQEDENNYNNLNDSITVIMDDIFQETDSYLNGANGIFSGCTAIVAFIREEEEESEDNDDDGEDGLKSEKLKMKRKLYTANVGDSRAVLFRDGKAIRLSYDHKGADPIEQQRVKDAGGFILNERVNGMLAITRALGDAEMKDFISSRPYTTETEIIPSDSLLILACDGLWDVCEDQEACELINEVEDPQKCADILIQHALKVGSMDNLSVLVIRFRHDR